MERLHTKILIYTSSFEYYAKIMIFLNLFSTSIHVSVAEKYIAVTPLTESEEYYSQIKEMGEWKK